MKHLSDYELYVLEKAEINCDDIEAMLGDHVDGDLTPTLEARLSDHIEDCDYCQEIEKGYRLTIQLAKELHLDAPMPKDVKRRFYAGLNEKLGLNLGL